MFEQLMSLSSQKSDLQRDFPTGLFTESLYIIVSDGKKYGNV